MAQSVQCGYKEYRSAIQQPYASSFFMHLSKLLNLFTFLVLLVLSPVIVFATESFEKQDDFLYYFITYPSSDQQDIAESQKYLQDYFSSRLEGYVDHHQYLVYATADELQHLQEQSLIMSYQPYTFSLADAGLAPHIGNQHEQTYLISLFHTADEQALAAQIQSLGGKTTTVHDEGFFAVLTGEQLQQAAQLEGIGSIELQPHYQLVNDKSVIATGVADVRSRFQLYGNGQIIAVLDSGLDTGKNDPSMHNDIEGRIVGITDMWNTAFCCSDNGTDYDSHGTRVAGIVLGNGVLSGSNPAQRQFANSYAGVAPEAKVDFYSASGNQGTAFIPAFPLNYFTFTPSYQKGARVHTNSWEVPLSNGKYLSGSRDVDNFMWQNKEYLIVFGAGNDLGVGSVSPPSTNKNGLSVSGIWRDDANKYVYSEGPTLDGRFKPDIRAPAVGYIGQTAGQGIISTKSSVQLPYPTGCQGGPGGNLNTYYCEISGTSASAPHVAGSAALLREFAQTRLNMPNPSAALIKAILLNGGQSVSGNQIPSTRDGFGRMNLTESLPSYPGYLATVDEKTGLTTGQKKTYTYYADVQQPFVITLAWTDAPPAPIYSNSTQTQKKLINDLDLIVTDPQGNQYFGNDITLPYNNQPDKLNNVEQVRIAAPLKGAYTVEVKAFSVPQGPQDYAFALTYHNRAIRVAPHLTAVVCMVNGTPC
ncbi:MAG: S8 family serine peptidase [Nanoarchaeota archaeon]